MLQEITKYVNLQRAGVGGRPLAPLECKVSQEKTLADCVAEFAANKVYAIVATDEGVGDIGAALAEASQSIPVVVANPIGVSVLVSQELTAITPGMPGLMLSLAIVATGELAGESKSVRVVHSGSEESN